MRNSRGHLRGVSLIELLIVITLIVVILAAATQAVAVAYRSGDRTKQSRILRTRDALFEDRLRGLLQAAYLSTDNADANSYFIGGDNSQDSDANLQTSGSGLTFTALGDRIPAEFVESEDEFENLNEKFGPRGGISEVSISLSAIGEAPVETGLFLRKQTPADGDSTQGGFESVLDPGVTEISFEFYTGTEWITTWNTQATNTPRLPSAIRVTYRRDQEDQDRIIVVRLPHSDVTPDNPFTDGEAAQ